MICRLACILLICSCFGASAAQQQRLHYYTGTGFFISAYGDLITNAHVVEGCLPEHITVKGAVESSARLIATDTQHDLALLRAEKGPSDSARLAATQTSIAPDDTVMVMGYPHGKGGPLRDYTVRHAKILDVRGPLAEEEWIQFSDASQRGNSGGPLLDDTGNVIGVVTAKSELFQVNARTREEKLVGRSDLAVALPVLKQFLTQNHIRFQQADSRVRRAPDYIESRARDFIVKVQCITRIETTR